MESTSRLVDTEKFNSDVGLWALTTRTKMVRRVPIGDDSNPRTKKLIATQYYVNLNRDGAAGNIRFVFPVHGIYIHYGVGRGWIRKNNIIVRGYRTERGIISKKKNIGRRIINKEAEATRTPIDWFDIEIKLGMNQLANIAQEYYGDEAMYSVLDRINRYLIEK